MTENIALLLPQKAPFVMVDGLIAQAEKSTKTTFFIHENNVLCHKGKWSEAGIIENIAQSTALHLSLRQMEADKSDNFKPKLGVIGAVKKFVLHKLPNVNTQVQTEISVKHEIGNALIVDALCLCNQQMVASCELSVFTVDE